MAGTSEVFQATGAGVRLLFLCQDAGLVDAQLSGKRLSLAEAGLLRDEVSTDEITPVAILSHYDARLADFPYTGFTTQGRRPIGPGAVRAGGFTVTVAGRRYGKGSSREHSPAAEYRAGIRLVIAESFERLYRQNADNIGLFTSTDLGLVERLQRGEMPGLDELLAGRDDLACAILRAGGLLRFGQRHLVKLHPSAKASEAAATPVQARSLFEKIVARHLLPTPVTPETPRIGDGVFVQADWRFIHEYYTGMAAHMLREELGWPVPLKTLEEIIVFEDHSAYLESSPAHLGTGLVPQMRRMVQAQRDFVQTHDLRCHRTLDELESAQDDGRHVAGISHAMMTEHYALPGQLITGTDSHTPHSGALGCVAFGVGTTDMANAFVTGAVRLTLPPGLRVALTGELPVGVTAKDIALHLLARDDIRAGLGVGKVFEFTGPVVAGLSVDERATLTNMCAELGGLTGIVAPDESTVAFLRERRGMDFVIEDWMHSDPDAH